MTNETNTNNGTAIEINPEEVKNLYGHITEGQLKRQGYDDLTIQTILSKTEGLKPLDYACLAFKREGVEMLFSTEQDKVRILGSVGTPTLCAPVTSVTRHGNVGWYINHEKGYIQLTLLPGERARVSASNHHPKTGQVMPLDEAGTLIAYPDSIVNLQLFSNEIHDQERLNELLEGIIGLQVGTYYDKVAKKNKPVYRSTDLIVLYQGDYPKKQPDGSLQISVSALTLVDTRLKAVKQLTGWAATPQQPVKGRIFNRQALDTTTEKTKIEPVGDAIKPVEEVFQLAKPEGEVRWSGNPALADFAAAYGYGKTLVEILYGTDDEKAEEAGEVTVPQASPGFVDF